MSQVRHNADAIVTDPASRQYVIDPRKHRKDCFYFAALLVFWVIWASATLFFALVAIAKPNVFLSIWLIFGFGLTIGIPLQLLNRNRKQILEIGGESLVVFGTGVLTTSKVRIDKHNLQALTLEHYGDDDAESVYTLNLLQNPGHRPARIMLAGFVHPRDKAVLFDEIAAFLHSHGFVFEVKNEMTAKRSMQQYSGPGRPIQPC